MPEVVDIVDNQTGMVHIEDMLAVSAYIWAASNGWKVVKEEVDRLIQWDGSPDRVIRWLWVESVARAD